MKFLLAIEIIILIYVSIATFEPVSFIGLAVTSIIGLSLAVKLARPTYNDSQNNKYGKRGYYK